jgi:DNA segregation ATPase FtsK/SpoIIIE-like protein
VSGRTGSGKTVFLKNIYESLSNSDCRFLIIDTKNCDFNNFNGKKNLFMPVISDVDVAIRTLDIVTEIIDERYAILKKQKFRNIMEYRKQFSDMPYLIVMIDEFADLMYKNKKIVETFVQYIAQKGRAVGIHLIVAVQKTERQVLSNLIMANMPTRIVFQMREKKQSVRILGESGAELLLPYGDMLYSESGRPSLRIHTGV